MAPPDDSVGGTQFTFAAVVCAVLLLLLPGEGSEPSTWCQGGACA
jgi:hypothetical protein